MKTQVSVPSQCFACGWDLGPIDGIMVTCTNPQCSAGGHFQACGFCLEYSLAMGEVTRICCNQDCQAYEIPHTFCNDCRRFSMRLLGNEHRCISRLCPSNRNRLDPCFFCHQRSLFVTSEIAVCFKSNCVMRGIEFLRCFFCEQRSFDSHQLKCVNPVCGHYEDSMELCPSCDNFAIPHDSHQCQNNACRFQISEHKDADSDEPQVNLATPKSGDTLFDLKVDSSFVRAMKGENSPEKQQSANAETDSGEQDQDVMSDAESPLADFEAFSRKQDQQAQTLDKIGLDLDATPMPQAFDPFKDQQDDSESKLWLDPDSSDSVIKIQTPHAAVRATHTFQDLPSIDESSGELMTSQREPALSLESSASDLRVPDSDQSQHVFDSSTFQRPELPDDHSGPERNSESRPQTQSHSNTSETHTPSSPANSGSPFRDNASLSYRDQANEWERAVTGHSPAPDDNKSESKPNSGSETRGISSLFDSAWPDQNKSRDESTSDSAHNVTTAPKENVSDVPDWISRAPRVRTRPSRPPNSAFTARPNTQKPKAGSQSQSGMANDAFLRAFHAVDRHFLKSQETDAPFYLVMGLPGSGKTTYLSVLGDILYHRTQKYFFPYDIFPRQVDIAEYFSGTKLNQTDSSLREINDHVKDLVYDFSHDTYNKYLSRGFWPPFTADSERYILLGELLQGETISRIATLEIAGEHYRGLLQTTQKFHNVLADRNNKQFVLSQLLNYSHGLLVLLSPNISSEEDQLYARLFRVISESLESRVAKCLRRLLGLAKQSREEFERMRLTVDFRERISQLQKASESGQKLSQHRYWSTMFQQLKSVDNKGFERQRRARERRLRHIEQVESPDARRALRRDLGREFDLRLIDLMRQSIEAIVQLELKKLNTQLSQSTTSVYSEEAIRRCLAAYFDIPMTDFDRIVDRRNSGYQGQTELFPHLQRVNIAITKADQYSICYPAKDFPHRRLRYSREPLAQLEQYLTVLGGALKYFNTSATGHTLVDNGSIVPGRAEYHSPINVAEPFFDLLDIQSHANDQEVRP